MGKVPENTEIVEFPKSELFNRTDSGNSGMKVEWNGNFQEIIFENLGIPHEVVFYFGIYAKSQFLGAYLPLSLASSRLGGAPTPPYLSLTPGWGTRLTRCLIRYLAGCVAATLITLLTFRMCCCHPHCFTHYY